MHGNLNTYLCAQGFPVHYNMYLEDNWLNKEPRTFSYTVLGLQYFLTAILLKPGKRKFVLHDVQMITNFLNLPNWTLLSRGKTYYKITSLKTSKWGTI